jgi:2-haloacid dehalogenase
MHLGHVLISWDPRLLYRKLLPSDVEVEEFLETVCTLEWDAQQDAGRPLDEGVAERIALFPDRAPLIEAWRDRQVEMTLPIPGTIELLRELHEREVGLYVLSNWGADEFDAIRSRYPFLEWFSGILISGKVGLVKPDPKFFALLMKEYRLTPTETVFIDDMPANVEAARQLGFHSILFTTPASLREALVGVGLLQ